MPPKKKNNLDGVITFHIPSHLNLFSKESKGICKAGSSCASESRTTPSRRSIKMRNTSGGLRARREDEAWGPGPSQCPWPDWLSHPSLRQQQAKLEAECQEAKVIIQPILDTENGFMKELESFLCRHDAAERQRKELLHRCWTEHVWMPIQKKMEEHVSNCCYDEAAMLRQVYNDYIHHCNTKGFVFLDTYNPQEYNPFLLNIVRPHYFKLKIPALRDPLFLQARQRINEKRIALSCKTGCRYTRRQMEQLLQDDLPHSAPLGHSVIPKSELPLPTSPNDQVSASRKPSVEEGTEQRKTNRPNAVPHQRFTHTMWEMPGQPVVLKNIVNATNQTVCKDLFHGLKVHTSS